MKKLILPVLILAVSIAFPRIIFAGSASTTLDVFANVQPSCDVQSTPIDFGAYDQSISIYATGNITVTCVLNTNYLIALDAGSNYDPQNDFRQLSEGTGSFLRYELYKSTAYTNPNAVWGDSSYGDTYISGYVLTDTGTGYQQNHTVYGILLGPERGQLVAPAGSYADVVNVTVFY